MLNGDANVLTITEVISNYEERDPDRFVRREQCLALFFFSYKDCSYQKVMHYNSVYDAKKKAVD